MLEDLKLSLRWGGGEGRGGGGTGGEGLNYKKVCFGRNTKFFRESKDFTGNRETYGIFGKA